jgi:hypothetical protein
VSRRYKTYKLNYIGILRLIIIIILSLSFLFIIFNLIFASNITASENSAEWQVVLNITEPNETKDTVTFGEKNTASDGKDLFDIPKPPAPQTPYIRAWFTTPFHPPYNMLWEEYKASSNNYKVWNLTILWISETSFQTDITISWDVSNVLASGYDSINLKSSDTIDMLVKNKYSYPANSNQPNNFQIILNNKTIENKSDKNEETSYLIPILVIIILVIIIVSIYIVKIKK